MSISTHKLKMRFKLQYFRKHLFHASSRHSSYLSPISDSIFKLPLIQCCFGGLKQCPSICWWACNLLQARWERRKIHKWYNDDQPHQDELTGATIIIKCWMQDFSRIFLMCRIYTHNEATLDTPASIILVILRKRRLSLPCIQESCWWCHLFWMGWVCPDHNHEEQSQFPPVDKKSKLINQISCKNSTICIEFWDSKIQFPFYLVAQTPKYCILAEFWTYHLTRKFPPKTLVHKSLHPCPYKVLWRARPLLQIFLKERCTQHHIESCGYVQRQICCILARCNNCLQNMLKGPNYHLMYT